MCGFIDLESVWCFGGGCDFQHIEIIAHDNKIRLVAIVPPTHSLTLTMKE
jgi:hypothetical protein